MAALLEGLDKAKAHNAGLSRLADAIEKAKRERNAAETNMESARVDVKRLKELLAAAESRLAVFDGALPSLDAAVAVANEAHTAFVQQDETRWRMAIKGAAEATQRISANETRTKLAATLPTARKAADDLTARIEAIDAEKTAALANAKFPVAGLSFDDNGVTFNGLPFSQASAAEQLSVSVAIAAALNPKLRVMLVRDGSLMDDKSLALLGELAAKNDLQVWVERVGKGDECSVIIEDGAVEGSGNKMVAISDTPDSPPVEQI